MVTKADVRALIDVDEDPAISIYMPVHATFPDRNKNVIRLRNLMRRAEDELRARGADPEAVLARARELLEPAPPVDGLDTAGLAIFITADEVRALPLPGRPQPLIHVGRGFHIAPLVPSVEHSRYFAITLDQTSPTLYRGNRASFERLAEGVTEQSLDEIRGVTQIPARTGYHASGPAGRGPSGRPDATHHAQGEAPEDYEQVELDQYSHAIARAVEKKLRGEEAPLIPVGQPNLLGMFRRHCRYPGLGEEAVAKSPAHLDDEELHRLTLEVASASLGRPAREAASRAVAAHSRGDATVAIEPRQILEAAGMGRVEALLLARSPNDGGVWVPEDESGETPGDGALLREELVRAVVGQGGSVMSVEPEALPGEASVAALYRF